MINSLFQLPLKKWRYFCFFSVFHFVFIKKMVYCPQNCLLYYSVSENLFLTFEHFHTALQESYRSFIMIKISICDDDRIFCRQLKQTVSQKLDGLKEPYTITCHYNSASLMAGPMDFDLLFLDIQMAGMDGISLARCLRQQDFPGAIIFTTILKDCMLDAFEVEAIDYLCKPIDDLRLENALKRTLKRHNTQNEKHLFIHTMNWCRSVRLCDILYCEVMNRKIYLHTQKDVVTFYGKLKDLEKQLDENFVKCHRSYIVNLAFIQEYSNGWILLENQSQIPVSRPHHQVLLDAMLEFMERRN
ncbi:DNA-binding response regulator [Clostridiaceae bacterium]|nr:DNA-binding response regulator [Clostridiaceae bacterium]NBH32205.1 DNA-binding response regulator [Clostridiaceae bacterium]